MRNQLHRLASKSSINMLRDGNEGQSRRQPERHGHGIVDYVPRVQAITESPHANPRQRYNEEHVRQQNKTRSGGGSKQHDIF
ncbi:MAG: hypothetical protein ACLTGI_05325 [Hoylesella buccalis]